MTADTIPVTHIVSHTLLEGILPLEPLFPAPEEGDWLMPETLERALFGSADTATACFVILDSGQIPNLPELLEQSGLKYRCLFSGQTGETLAENSPWLVQLVSGARFTRDLFTASDAVWHLWGAQRCIIVRSSQDFHAIWKHFRRLTRIEDAQGKTFYFRFWEAPYFRAALMQGSATEAGQLVPQVSQTLLPRADGLETIEVAPQPKSRGIFILSAALKKVFGEVALQVFYARLEKRHCEVGNMTRSEFTQHLSGALHAGFRDRDVLEALLDWCAEYDQPVFAQPWAEASLAATAGLKDISRMGNLKRASRRQKAKELAEASP
ncbi:DUF4123 domain-containing protein [Litoreibacter albidus]|uniref:DUF4123 domain-containing protein n=1 Tax=Litoreibacter albidus TaxID=670155 RepID=A0A1H3D3B4_9RHOB|nr:DUF4123 domain-containing protein [Litoreibacter albidus]SDX60810.1 protein of unknown function [Litoreibacter albidus]